MLVAARNRTRSALVNEGRYGVKRRAPVFLILGVLSVGVVALIIHFVGLRHTLGVLAQAGVRAFVAMLVLSLAWLTFGAMAWDRLGRPVGHRIPFHTLLKGVLIGFVGNFVTPSMYLGGEPWRVAYVGRRRDLPFYQVAGTVLLTKYLEFMAFVLLMGIGTTVTLLYYWDDLWDVARVAIGVGTGGLLGVVVLLMVALRGRHRPISAVIEWLIRRRILRRALRRRRRGVRQMEDQISRTFNREGLAAWTAFACLSGGFAALFIRPLIFFCFLKEPRIFSFPELCLIFVLTQFILALQVTPGSLGAYEGGMIGIFAMLGGVGEPAALAYVICMRAADAVLLLTGLFVATHQGIKILRRGPRGPSRAVEELAVAPVGLAPADVPNPGRRQLDQGSGVRGQGSGTDDASPRPGARAGDPQPGAAAPQRDPSPGARAGDPGPGAEEQERSGETQQ